MARKKGEAMKKIIAIILLLLLMPTGSPSQTNEPRDSLRGLRAVYVRILPIQKDAQTDGLSATQIQKTVMAQLRNAGIRVHTSPDLADGSASLTVVIDTIKHPQGPYIYSVTVSLVQEVHLARIEKRETFAAETWSKKALGLTTANKIASIQEPLREKVSEFISDYFAANPKT